MKQNYSLQKWPLKALLVCAGLAFFNGCIDPDEVDFDRIADTQWKPDMAIPLVNSSLTAADIITKGDKDGRIEIAPDKFCTLIYEGDLDARHAEDLVILPNQSLPQQDANMTALAVAAFGIAPVGGTATYSYNTVMDFSSGSLTIDSVLFKGDSVSITFVSTIQHDAAVTLTFTEATKNGSPLTLTTNLNASNSYQNTASGSINGYMFDMTNGGFQTNKMPVKVDVTLTKTSASNLPTTTDKISFTPSLSNIQWKRIHGDIGTISLSTGVPDSVLFSAFRNSLFTGHIVHADPKVLIQVRNSFGIPVDVTFVSVKGSIPAPDPGAGEYPVTGSGLSTMSVNAPTFAQIGQTITSGRQLDQTNSNVRQVINLNPQFFVTNLNFTANPSGTPPTHNFLLDTSELSANIRCELPLYGQATGFELVKDFEFEFKDSDIVESATMRTIITNGFPLDVQVQIYFLDQFNNPVDSLVKNAANLIPVKAGIVDGTGKVVQSTTATTDNTIDQARWKIISAFAKKIQVRAKLDSQPSATDIKIYSDYTLDVKLGARVKMKLKVETK